MSRSSYTSLLVIGLVIGLGACAAPRSLPEGPTPIPTLIPATDVTGPLGTSTTSSFTVLSYPARPPSAALGQPLYETNCTRCHGDNGKGVVPGARDFTDLDFMRGETPASFYGTVTDGRGQMPAFQDTLTSDQRWDAVFYVWRFSTNTETLALGRDLFKANCAVCHGEDGTGKVLGAADFTDLRVVDDLAPRDLYLTVTQGKGSMPAWQGRLSQDERWAVIDYVRTFSYDPSLSQTGEATEAPTAAPSEVACSPAAPSQVNLFSWTDQAAIDAGRAIFEAKCAACHGRDGSGALPGAPDFTAADWQQELRDQNGEIRCILEQGSGVMPAWQGKLTDEQMWQVLTYLSTLGR